MGQRLLLTGIERETMIEWAMKQDKIKEKPSFWATVRYLLLTIIA